MARGWKVWLWRISHRAYSVRENYVAGAISRDMNVAEFQKLSCCPHIAIQDGAHLLSASHTLYIKHRCCVGDSRYQHVRAASKNVICDRSWEVQQITGRWLLLSLPVRRTASSAAVANFDIPDISGPGMFCVHPQIPHYIISVYHPGPCILWGPVPSDVLDLGRALSSVY